jgi:probable H4MPT-linked C1 transfer pathway protein
MSRAILGLDVGGANLKASHTQGAARFHPSKLWKHPDELAGTLGSFLSSLPGYELLAVTMTGELCDCFETKRQGVQFILDAVRTVAAESAVRVWRNDGKLVDLATARQTPLQVAAANWLALATWAGRHAPSGPALLLDIGSTTTDIIPLQDGVPVPRGRTDPERLRAQELVYTGVRRTPVCALLGGGGAAELFATTRDVFLVLGALPEHAEDRDTADGRPATRIAAQARLARMVCADAETCSPADSRKLAERVLLKQVYLIQSALEIVARHLAGPPRTVILAGSGEFLARLVLAQLSWPSPRIVSLAEMLGPDISQSACAYALAMLAAEASGPGG